MQPPYKIMGLMVTALLACATGNLAFAPIQAQAPATTPVVALAKPQPPANYVLGPDDEVSIMAKLADNLSNRPLRISKSGDLTVPEIGRIHAAGMTVEDLEREVKERLKATIRQPDVVITITQFKSQSVSVIGSVNAPSEVQLEGHKTLIEVLNKAGWLRTDAGSRVKITRRLEVGTIPLPYAVNDAQYSVAEVSVTSLANLSRPEENIQILPGDIISVPRAEIVYVMGSVKTPGGFALNEKTTVTLMQALAMAGDLTATASKKDAKIIRGISGESPIEIPVNIADVMKNKTPNLTLRGDDILYVPDSYAKGSMRRTLDQVISSVTGMAIYRR